MRPSPARFSLPAFVVSLLAAVGTPSPAFAQSADCGVSADADSFSYSVPELCAGANPTTFRWTISETIFHEAFSFEETVDIFCRSGPHRGVVRDYPPNVYGLDTGTLTVTTTDAPDVKLCEAELDHVHARGAAVQLVLDRSGSMDNDGKIHDARAAAGAFIDTIPALMEIRPGDEVDQHYGVVLFNQAAEVLDLEPMNTACCEIVYEQPNGMSALVIDRFDHYSPNGLTSIGDGLRLAREGLVANVADLTRERPVILVLSDGKENTAPMIASQTQALVDASIPVYSIGVGEGYALNEEKLTQLGIATAGTYSHVTDSQLRTKHFLEVLVDSFRETNIVNDRVHLIAEGETQTHTIEASRHEERIVAVLAWRDPAYHLDATLGPGQASVVDRGKAYRILWVRICDEPGESDCTPPGTLQLTVTAKTPGSQTYTLTVLSRSAVDLALAVPRSLDAAGKAIPIAARFADGSSALQDVEIMVQVVGPAENMYQKLGIGIGGPPEKVDRTQPDGLTLPSERKANEVYGGKPVPKRTLTIGPLEAKLGADEQLQYVGQVPEKFVAHPGTYNLLISAAWQDSDGVTLRREATRSVFVLPGPVKRAPVDKTRWIVLVATGLGIALAGGLIAWFVGRPSPA